MYAIVNLQPQQKEHKVSVVLASSDSLLPLLGNLASALDRSYKRTSLRSFSVWISAFMFSVFRGEYPSVKSAYNRR